MFFQVVANLPIFQYIYWKQSTYQWTCAVQTHVAQKSTAVDPLEFVFCGVWDKSGVSHCNSASTPTLPPNPSVGFFSPLFRSVVFKVWSLRLRHILTKRLFAFPTVTCLRVYSVFRSLHNVILQGTECRSSHENADIKEICQSVKLCRHSAH